MKPIIDAFWRALVYCMHPRVIMWSFIPLLLMVLLWGTLGYFFWNSALEQIRASLEDSVFVEHAWAWLEGAGVGQLKAVLAPLIVVCVATPIIVMLCLLAVSLCLTPAIVTLLARRRFSGLQRLKGASFLSSLAWSLGSAALALVALLACTPLWFVPPLVLVLPPLIGGWLTYRVMAYDALAEHASAQERRTIFHRHRLQLLAMGVVVGYLGAAPSLIWSFGIMTFVWAPILIPASIWLYTLVFTFASLWFVHFCLAALGQLRAEPHVEELSP